MEAPHTSCVVQVPGLVLQGSQVEGAADQGSRMGVVVVVAADHTWLGDIEDERCRKIVRIRGIEH